MENVHAAAEVAEEKRIVTQEDLDNNPDLVEQGVSVGDEISFPVTGSDAVDESNNTEEDKANIPGNESLEENTGDDAEEDVLDEEAAGE